MVRSRLSLTALLAVGLCLAAPEKDKPNFSKLYTEAHKKIQKTRRDLFVSGLPKLETIRQGRLGDCFCLAPLGAMLARNPYAQSRQEYPLGRVKRDST